MGIRINSDIPKAGHKFDLQSTYKPSGDQPQAIKQLLDGIHNHQRDQLLLGVTGSGKTFTMANIINTVNRPTLIMAHNKTLAAQLYKEMKEFFPHNAVEYFVSYYDYYQPEAYIAHSDTYIDKDASINDYIDRMRHSATRSLLERNDVIVIASVSCIYGLGSPELYSQMRLSLEINKEYEFSQLLKNLVSLHYSRNDMSQSSGTFCVRGDTIIVYPVHTEQYAWRLSFFGNLLEEIAEVDTLTNHVQKKMQDLAIYASSHFVTPISVMEKSIPKIKEELRERIKFFDDQNKYIERQRIDERTRLDLEMMVETHTCRGIENYSRYLTGRAAGSPPPTLMEYLPDDALLFVDESHITIPQVRAMYNGDKARKTSLVNYGFRLPSALDNRPLTFEEWNNMRPQTIHVSATPAIFELELVNHEYVSQIIRPTYLPDPICIVRSLENQIDDVIQECRKAIKKNNRVLVITLTKKSAEQLSDYFEDIGIKAGYLHSEIKTLERTEMLNKLRSGVIDVLIGINLLREGLDLPECALVAVLDADKEGFLRSETSLIQIIGRAARHIDGTVILYADRMTRSLTQALEINKQRRAMQLDYNHKHQISPKTIKSSTKYDLNVNHEDQQVSNSEKDVETLRKEMIEAADRLDFEKAAQIRDQILRSVDN